MATWRLTLVARLSGLVLLLAGHVAHAATPETSPAASPQSSAVPAERPRPAPSPSPIPSPKSSPAPDANHVLRLYTDGFAASYLPVPGFAAVDMPVRDAAEGGQGCYIACCAHERRGSIYAPDGNTFVVGAVRILGNYQNGVCRPGGQERTDLAGDTRLSELCALAMPKLCDRRHCFASGDTGTWVPPSQAGNGAGSQVAEPHNGEESCVLACYSHNEDGALYQVASDVWAVGGFQATGKYVESVCKPQNYEGDMGADPVFKRRCTELFPKQCAGDACWANGDTRGRLGGH